MKLVLENMNREDFLKKVNSNGGYRFTVQDPSVLAKFAEDLRFECIDDILAEVPWAKHITIWSPGMMPLGEAKRQGFARDYLDRLEDQIEILIFRGGYFDVEQDDRLQFSRKNGVWKPDRFHLQRKYNQDYLFEGVSPRSHEHVYVIS
jgi:hypothetical protein